MVFEVVTIELAPMAVELFICVPETVFALVPIKVFLLEFSVFRSYPAPLPSPTFDELIEL